MFSVPSAGWPITSSQELVRESDLGTDAHPWFSLTLSHNDSNCWQPLLWDQEAVPRQRGWGIRNWGHRNTPKVFILDGNFMRVLKKASLKFPWGTSIFFVSHGLFLRRLPSPSLLSKYSQCVNKRCGSYATTLPGHPLKEMVLVFKVQGETAFSYGQDWRSWARFSAL